MSYGGDPRRFYTNPQQFSCGIDLHARRMSVCILSQEGAILVPRHMPAAPEPFLQAMAPYRDQVVVAVECSFTWYWLADLCAQAGIPLVLGPALSLQAMHGGKAQNDTSDAHKMAVLLRGGMRPQASVSPAAMRATRALLRRRMHLMRQRAELLAHVQNTQSQYTLPEIGKKIAYKAHRDGGAERLPAPAVHKSIEVALALLDYYDRLLTDLALQIVPTATPHDATTCSRLRSLPGVGKSLALVMRYAIHDSQRFPRAGFCVVLSPRQVCQGIRRPTLRDVGQEKGHRLPHVGLCRSGGPVSAPP